MKRLELILLVGSTIHAGQLVRVGSSSQVSQLCGYSIEYSAASQDRLLYTPAFGENSMILSPDGHTHFSATRDNKLFEAISDDNVSALAILIRSYQDGGEAVDLRTVDLLGRTPLMWAAKLTKKKMVSFLLSLGLDAKAEDIHGYTFVDYALYKAEIIAAIEEHNKHLDESSQSYVVIPDNTEDDDRDTIMMKISRYAMPRAVDLTDLREEKQKVLQEKLRIAIINKNKDEIQALVDAGADLKACHIKELIEEYFMMAIQEHALQETILWLELGADLHENLPEAITHDAQAMYFLQRCLQLMKEHDDYELSENDRSSRMPTPISLGKIFDEDTDDESEISR
jgi:hypothetical protein